MDNPKFQIFECSVILKIYIYDSIFVEYKNHIEIKNIQI